MFLDGQNTGLSFMVLLLPFEDSHDLPARRGAFPELSQAGTQPLAAACSPCMEQHYGTAAAGKTISCALGSSRSLTLLLASRRQK